MEGLYRGPVHHPGTGTSQNIKWTHFAVFLSPKTTLARILSLCLSSCFYQWNLRYEWARDRRHFTTSCIMYWVVWAPGCLPNQANLVMLAESQLFVDWLRVCRARHSGTREYLCVCDKWPERATLHPRRRRDLCLCDTRVQFMGLVTHCTVESPNVGGGKGRGIPNNLEGITAFVPSPPNCICKLTVTCKACLPDCVNRCIFTAES